MRHIGLMLLAALIAGCAPETSLTVTVPITSRLVWHKESPVVSTSGYGEKCYKVDAPDGVSVRGSVTTTPQKVDTGVFLRDTFNRHTKDGWVLPRVSGSCRSMFDQATDEITYNETPPACWLVIETRLCQRTPLGLNFPQSGPVERHIWKIGGGGPTTPKSTSAEREP